MVVEGRRRDKKANPELPLPTSRILKIASLKKFPDKDYARSLLHDVAKLVAPIMHEHNFRVGLLCEMYPKSGNLLGLNVNKGQKIMLRLRYHSNSRLFLPISDILGTMLHELTHNLHGPHNQQFYLFLDKLKLRFEEIQYNPVKGYICEESKLGGRGTSGYMSIRDKRVAALGKGIFKAEVRKLGGAKKSSDLRLLALEAAERRLRDSKWCNNNEDAEPRSDELDVVDLTGPQAQAPPPPPPPPPPPASTASTAATAAVATEIIDLTVDDDEIVVIN